jgi:hypothetical protein
MIIVHPTSLNASLDLAAEAFFYQKPISKSQREEFAALLAGRQSKSGVNAGFFIPFTAESEAQVKLFSGEQLRTALAIRHIQLLEAARILNLLVVENHNVAQVIEVANRRMKTMCYASFCVKGECRHLTIAFMRYLAVTGSNDTQPRLNGFLTQLAGYRDGKGKWGSFPFYYTLLMLTEINDPQADQECQYAAPTCEKNLKRNWDSDPISKRRQTILNKVLTRI